MISSIPRNEILLLVLGLTVGISVFYSLQNTQTTHAGGTLPQQCERCYYRCDNGNNTDTRKFASGRTLIKDFDNLLFPPTITRLTVPTTSGRVWQGSYAPFPYSKHHLLRIKNEWTCLRSLSQQVKIGPFNNDFAYCFQTESISFEDGFVRNSCEWPLPPDFSVDSSSSSSSSFKHRDGRTVHIIKDRTLIASGIFPWSSGFQHFAQDSFPQVAKGVSWAIRTDNAEEEEGKGKENTRLNLAILHEENQWLTHFQREYFPNVEIIPFHEKDYFCSYDTVVGFHEPRSFLAGPDMVGVNAVHRLVNMDLVEGDGWLSSLDMTCLGGSASKSHKRIVDEGRPSKKERNLVIYLGRPTTKRRKVLNDAEVAAALQKVVDDFNAESDPKPSFSYEFVYFKEAQKDKTAVVELFQRARVIVGMHGGAFGNMLFTPVDSQSWVIEFVMGGQYQRNWKNLALSSGATYVDQAIPCPNQKKDCDPDSANVNVPIPKAEFLVRSAMMALESRLGAGDFSL
jgi:hypothetical protein